MQNRHIVFQLIMQVNVFLTIIVNLTSIVLGPIKYVLAFIILI